MSKRYLQKNEFRLGRPPGIKKKTTQNKQNSKVDIGQTLKTEDKFLPYNKKTTQQLKQSRPVIVVDKVINKQGKEEYAIVPTSTQKGSNTTYYGKFGIERFRHTLEIEDDEGKPITKNDKFKLTQKCSKLPKGDAERIYEKVLNHTKQSSVNREKFDKFKSRHKKSKS